jgi:hypothetical protein
MSPEGMYTDGDLRYDDGYASNRDDRH